MTTLPTDDKARPILEIVYKMGENGKLIPRITRFHSPAGEALWAEFRRNPSKRSFRVSFSEDDL